MIYRVRSLVDHPATSALSFLFHYTDPELQEAEDYFDDKILPHLPFKLAERMAYFEITPCFSMKPEDLVLLADEDGYLTQLAHVEQLIAENS